MGDSKPAWVHPTALVEEGVTLGPNTRVWDGVHIRKEARIGHDTIVAERRRRNITWHNKWAKRR